MANEQLAPYEPLVLPRHVPYTILTSQGIRLVGVLVENAVSYCRVSRPRCQNIPCSCTNHDITCRLQTTLRQAHARLLLVEFRFHRVRRQVLASPCQIDCVLLRQVHCHVRQIVHEVQVTRNRYFQAQVLFQRIQTTILHSSCRSQHAQCLHQLQRSCCIQTCQRLENTSLLLNRVGCLLSTILHQQQYHNIAAVIPPPAPTVHNPQQATIQPASLIGPENIQPFQVQVEERSRDLVSET